MHLYRIFFFFKPPFGFLRELCWYSHAACWTLKSRGKMRTQLMSTCLILSISMFARPIKQQRYKNELFRIAFFGKQVSVPLDFYWLLEKTTLNLFAFVLCCNYSSMHSCSISLPPALSSLAGGDRFEVCWFLLYFFSLLLTAPPLMGQGGSRFCADQDGSRKWWGFSLSCYFFSGLG